MFDSSDITDQWTNLHSIEAIIDPENHSSARILEKNGFIKEAHLVENEFFDGKFIDTVIYSILKRNYPNVASKL